MITSRYRVGGEIDAKCGKCKEDTTHVIVAMVDGEPRRVECLSCHAQHNYRSTIVHSSQPKATRSFDRPKEKAVYREDVQVVEYSADGKYEEGMTINHKVFGRGKVKRVQARKLTVAFRDKVRMLIINPPS